MCETCQHGLQQLLDNDPREEIEAQIQAYPDISSYLTQIYNEVSNIMRMIVQAKPARVNEEYVQTRRKQIEGLLERRDRAITNYKNGEPIPEENPAGKMRISAYGKNFDKGYQFPTVNYAVPEESEEEYSEEYDEYDEPAIPHPDEQPQEVQASKSED